MFDAVVGALMMHGLLSKCANSNVQTALATEMAVEWQDNNVGDRNTDKSKLHCHYCWTT
jgi:hypothetical protein